MDQKSWLWKKRSTEKTLLADKASNSPNKSEVTEVTEIQKLHNEKAELERDLKILDEKLSFALSECNAKDNIAMKQVKIAEEAIAGWEKAETEAVSLKQELDRVLQLKSASDERICHLDGALKECMQQLRVVREEHEKSVHNAAAKTSEDFHKVRIVLDEKLAEASRRLAIFDDQNTHLSKAISEKNKLIEDLSKYRTQLEADFNGLKLRVESTEKENASLKYEIRVLEKELDIRNEEREFNRRTAEVAQKQHLKNVGKIGELEVECQRLRLLVQKRFPGPAALAKMKSEVEILGKEHNRIIRRKPTSSSNGPVELLCEATPDAPSERIDVLTRQLYTMEEENKTLKDALHKKSSELQHSRTTSTYANSVVILSPAEGKSEESPNGQKVAEPKRLPFLQEHSLAASSDLGSDDKASCAESWASALLSELEHFKNEKQLGASSNRNMKISDMNLMDDFAEMEKLAVVSTDYAAESSYYSTEKAMEIVDTSRSLCGRIPSSIPGMELVPGPDCPSGALILDHETPSESVAANRVILGVGDLLKMLLDHCRVSQKTPHKVLEDMEAALEGNVGDATFFCGNGNAHQPDKSHNRSENVAHTSLNPSMNLDASEAINGNDISDMKNGQKPFPNMSISINKILELLEGINMQSQDNGTPGSFSGKDGDLLSYKNSENPAGYIVRVFQWKSVELSAILQQLVSTCNDLLNGTADLEQFSLQVASGLEWVINHCFSIQDVSSMKDAIRNHFDWDDSISETDIDCGLPNHSIEFGGGLHTRREDTPKLPRVSLLSGHSSSHGVEFLPLTTKEGETWNITNNELSVLDIEGRHQPEIVEGESFRTQLQQSNNMIENLHSQMETTNESNGECGTQIERQQMIKEHLTMQVTEISNEWRKALQKISCLENELETKNNLCIGLEGTCQDLKMQLESLTSKEVPENGKHSENQLQNDWEITTASEKLAECQETIINLGKQLKALASPNDVPLFDKVLSKPAESISSSLSASERTTSQRSSLLDKMQAEDSHQSEFSLTEKEDIQNCSSPIVTEACNKLDTANGINHEEKSEIAVTSLDVVPSKKNRRWSFLKKLSWRKKKGNAIIHHP